VKSNLQFISLNFVTYGKLKRFLSFDHKSQKTRGRVFKCFVTVSAEENVFEKVSNAPCRIFAAEAEKERRPYKILLY